MSQVTLARRRQQLDTLAQACADGATARVQIRAAGDGHGPRTTRFLALDDESILLFWPNHADPRFANRGAKVEVFFQLGGAYYCFCADGEGRFRYTHAEGNVIPALRLRLPLRVEQKQQRDHFRVSLAGLAAVVATLKPLAADEPVFSLRLTNISGGGFGGVIDDPRLRDLTMNEIFCATLDLPDDTEPLTAFVRLAHRRQISHERGDTRCMTGWAFCPGDDHAKHDLNLRRLERFVAAQQRAELQRNAERKN